MCFKIGRNSYSQSTFSLVPMFFEFPGTMVIEVFSSKKKPKLLDSILACQWLVGVVADPEFSEEDERLDIIFAVVELLNWLIFNGSEMISSDGKPILSAES